MANNSIPSVSTLLNIASHPALPSPKPAGLAHQGTIYEEGALSAANGPATSGPPAGPKTSSAPRRGPWLPEEDHKLMELIAVFGPTNWVSISNNLGTRTPKQCRERYHQNLKPTLNRTPITPDEGELIEQLVAKYGKKWAEIARHLNGRSDNSIKNWWNSGASKRRRASTQHDLLAAGAATKDDTSVHSQTKEPRPLPLPQLAAAGPPLAPQTHQLPQISFNTLIFATPSSKPAPDPLPRYDGPVLHQHPTSRLSSLDYSTQLPPVFGAKRRLIDEYPLNRRHSTATSTLSTASHASANSSNPNLASYSIQPNHSPLLLSNPNSRHNSISMFEFTSLNNSSQNNSSTTSRRSSIAPDFFPNPLKDGYKHPAAKFGDIPEVGGSPTQATCGLAKSNSNLNHVFMAQPKKEEPASHGAAETKISVSSLID